MMKKSVKYTKALAKEYNRLYKSCVIDSKRFKKVDRVVSDILNNRSRYENVAKELNIPWYFIAAVHNMESSQDFTMHLHNGDTLHKRTTHIPAGRPAKGEPPFTWEVSAIDALKFKRLHKIDDWTLARKFRVR